MADQSPRSPLQLCWQFYLWRHANVYDYRTFRDDIASPLRTDNRSCTKCGKRNVNSYMNKTAHFHLFWLSFTKTFKIGKGRRRQSVFLL